MTAADLIYKLQDLLDGENDEVVIVDEQAGLEDAPITDIYREGNKIFIDTTDYSGLV